MNTYRGKRVVNWDPVLKTSVSDIETERRTVKGKLYFISTTLNVLEQYEKQILQNAGVPTTGRQVLKFIPKPTEDTLAQAEAAYYIEKRSKEFRIPDIAKTVFECRQKKKGGGFEFVVIDQRYLGSAGVKK